jgi:hypothetical protein
MTVVLSTDFIRTAFFRRQFALQTPNSLCFRLTKPFVRNTGTGRQILRNAEVAVAVVLVLGTYLIFWAAGRMQNAIVAPLNRF